VVGLYELLGNPTTSLIEPSGPFLDFLEFSVIYRFSPGTPASSTTKTGRHDIAEILPKVAVKHNKSNQINKSNQPKE
jgi:hypothetical protein